MTQNRTHRALLVFAIEAAILVAILSALDRAPGWVLEVGAAVAIAVPIVYFMTIVFAPSTLGLWLSVLKEFRAAFESAVRIVWGCFSKQTFRRVLKRVKAIQAFPETADDWLALPLIPFKAYILMTFPVFWTCRALHRLFLSDGYGLHYSQALITVMPGYGISLLVLLLGAILQTLFKRKERARQTEIIFLLGFGLLLFSMFMPATMTGR